MPDGHASIYESRLCGVNPETDFEAAFPDSMITRRQQHAAAIAEEVRPFTHSRIGLMFEIPVCVYARGQLIRFVFTDGHRLNVIECFLASNKRYRGVATC